MVTKEIIPMARRWSLLSMASIATLTLAACAGVSGSPEAATSETSDAATSETSQVLASSTFSNDVCVPKDAAAVADIPGSVSGFTGYESEPGDWLSLPDVAGELAGKSIALSVMGLGQPFFLAVVGHWEALSEQYGFDLKVYDGKFDAGTVQQLVDDIIVARPDAVVFAPLDSDASVPQVQKMLDAGLPVVTYNVQPRFQATPRVFADDYLGSQIVGCNAGAYFAAKFPDRDAKIGIVDLPELPQVMDRRNGFLYGFLSQIPNAELVQAVDGGGVIDKANPAATDLIQANPEINVIFGINDDSSLGTIGALRAAGKYDVEWGVLAAVDGSAPAMESMKDPNSPYKAESGYPPRDFAYAAFNLLIATLNGETGPTTQVIVGYPPINPTVEGIETWLIEQYPG